MRPAHAVSPKARLQVRLAWRADRGPLPHLRLLSFEYYNVSRTLGGSWHAAARYDRALRLGRCVLAACGARAANPVVNADYWKSMRCQTESFPGARSLA